MHHIKSVPKPQSTGLVGKYIAIHGASIATSTGVVHNPICLVLEERQRQYRGYSEHADSWYRRDSEARLSIELELQETSTLTTHWIYLSHLSGGYKLATEKEILAALSHRM